MRKRTTSQMSTSKRERYHKFGQCRGSGTHWVAYAKRGCRAIYFDSFGNLRPPKELVQYLDKKCCENRIQSNVFQNYNPSNCGQLCLRFLETIGTKFKD